MGELSFCDGAVRFVDVNVPPAAGTANVTGTPAAPGTWMVASTMPLVLAAIVPLIVKLWPYCGIGGVIERSEKGFAGLAACAAGISAINPPTLTSPLLI